MVFLFNEASGKSVIESKTSTNIEIKVGPGEAERIGGVEGNAIRTNGYYGWAEGNISKNLPAKSITISGWVTPQAFPVHRKDEDDNSENTVAAIFSKFNPVSTKGVEFGINHFGQVIGRFVVNDALIEFVSDKEVELHEWNFIALTIDAEIGVAKLFLNGQNIKKITFSKGLISWSTSNTVYIGRGAKNKKFINYQTNSLTGAIDAVVVWNRSMTSSEVLKIYNIITPTKPNLTIPIDERFSEDNHRPKYHLVPSAAWSNESHGLIYMDNKYHIFSQRNYNGPYLQHINWGHFESTDLIHWDEVKQALWPQPGFDEVGIWSGHAIIENGTPYLFYTGVDKAKAGIGFATGNSPYDVWTKSSANPVISNAPSSIPNADFRDPYLFKHNTKWMMMIGTGLRSGASRGGLFLYESNGTDFTSWNLKGTMFEGNPTIDGTGDFWEMPVYWDFGDKSILLVNKLPDANALYWVGNFNGSKFISDISVPNKLDIINQLLAPTINADANGDLVAIGIIPDAVSAEKHSDQGWANVFSLPRTWELINGKLAQKPHSNLTQLRGVKKNFSNVAFSSGGSNYLNGASGTQYEITAEMDKGSATKVGFILNQGAAEKTIIYYDYSNNQFVVDRSNSSFLTTVSKENQVGSYTMPAGNINWRIFVDASVIEVFINNEAAFTTRVFPSKSSTGIDLYAFGGAANIVNLDLYNITSGGTSSAQKMNGFTKQEFTDITVYPNPSKDIFNIELNVVEEECNAIIYIIDIVGVPRKQILVRLSTENNIVRWDGRYDDGRKAPQGVYILKGMMGNKLIESKLIVE